MKEAGKNLLNELFGAKGQESLPPFPGFFKKPERIERDPAEEKKRVNEFDSESDFILSMIIIALMHVNPELTPEKAIDAGREWARRMSTPNTNHLWQSQVIRIKRHGVRAEASKIRREMFKLL